MPKPDPPKSYDMAEFRQLVQQSGMEVTKAVRVANMVFIRLKYLTEQHAGRRYHGLPIAGISDQMRRSLTTYNDETIYRMAHGLKWDDPIPNIR